MAKAKQTPTAPVKPQQPEANGDMSDADIIAMLSDATVVGGVQQGRSEVPLDNGMTYDQLAQKVIDQQQGGTVILLEGTHFNGPGKRHVKLESVFARVKNALANRDKRGDLTLTPSEVRIEQIAKGQQLLVNGKQVPAPKNMLRLVKLSA
jgi:hypothetical protein